ncbi:DUF4330 domain-containing protein [Pseudoflavonifractor sp. MSJ-37]|uniref:DUF4330 domain-containing protein n=1 Tax=Pseudoflavonifractor sp. MSJ-37 TaxID=2841531 RepID=UPI001C11CACD|nr:DUF4330 domain-containing protein [Pseudoflavonifractor sp. MSJ-37]MBU5434709.1 DUF4330 domain-containing protein [Pseudoflavonifractor sp. MSJ-37]
MLDEKGRLFGKINIVDLLVLVLVVAIAAVAAIRLMGKGGTLPGESGGKAKLTYTVQVNSVYPEIYDSIKEYIDQVDENGQKGDELMASGNLLRGYVTDVTSQPHDNAAIITSSTGALTIPLADDLLDLTFTVEVTVPDRVTNEVGTQEVRIGKTHTLKTAHFEFANGVITDCQWEGAE